MQANCIDAHAKAIANISMDSLNSFLSDLNPEQLEAVTATEGYIRVIAGAGSGKTKALTTRFAYIVEALGISSSSILCVTFTNKAAREMKNRVAKMIGSSYINYNISWFLREGSARGYYQTSIP